MNEAVNMSAIVWGERRLAPGEPLDVLSMLRMIHNLRKKTTHVTIPCPDPIVAAKAIIKWNDYIFDENIYVDRKYGFMRKV